MNNKENTWDQDYAQGKKYEQITRAILEDFFGEDADEVEWVDHDKDKRSKDLQENGVDVIVRLKSGKEIHFQVKSRSSKYPDFAVEGKMKNGRFIPQWPSDYMVFWFEESGKILTLPTGHVKALWERYGESLGKIYPVDREKNKWILAIKKEVVSWGPDYINTL